MSVRIQLDDPHAFYTNLDYISGRVVLSLANDEAVSGIVVKLEGESRSVLMRPMHQSVGSARRRDRSTIALENHKVLYRVSQVFPTKDAAARAGSAYTLRAGPHEYPFSFKIPFNNGCADPQSQQMGPGSGFGGFGLAGLQQMGYRHVKRTLPPSLTGFPGEAEIRYYVKVTVQRPSLFKENRRSAMGFKFLPIEPPRSPPTTNEVYARRPYAFQAGLAGYPSKGGLFGGKKPAAPLSGTPPKGEVDARLPSPAVMTCNEPIPLRLIFRKLNMSPEYVFLTSLQINLIGRTDVRAQDVARTEVSNWVIMSSNGLSMQIGNPSDALRTETVVDRNLWNRIPLPNTVAPSFHTCNISRRYELEVTVGLGYGTPGNIQPQAVTLPLRFQIEIYSGISPPPALLNAIASRPAIPARPPAIPQRPPHDPAYPPQLPAGAIPEDDVPPSYEDAMADEITPADGPRREYSGVTDVNAPGLDEKAPRYSAPPGGPPGGGGGGGTGGGGGAVV